MNKVILMGRLTREPDIRYSQGERQIAIARFTLAVNRRAAGQEQQADFISCVSFGKAAEFAEKYLHQGTKLVVTGRIQTGSYINRDGQRVYTTDVIVEEQEFAESKSHSVGSGQAGEYQNRPLPEFMNESGFMNVPEGMDDEELPFH